MEAPRPANSIFLFAATVLSLFLLPTAPAADPANTRRAFVERAWPSNYEAVEALFNEQFSKTAETVFLRTRAAQPVSALALQPLESGDYRLTFSVPSEEAADGWLRITTEFDGQVGRQVARAVELKLHRHVTVGAGPRRVSKTESDIWIYQRGAAGRTSAAVISAEAAYENPEADLFIDELLGGLQQLIGVDGDARNELLQKIDSVATKIILSEPTG